jgi:hypothetical protein
MKKIIELIKSLFSEGSFTKKLLTIKNLEKEVKGVVNGSEEKTEKVNYKKKKKK